MFVERPQFYRFPVTSQPAGSIQEGLTLVTELDAPFRLSGIAIWTNDAAGGAFDGQIAIRFQRPDGRLIQRIFAPGSAVASGNQNSAGTPNPNQALVTPITPNIVYPPGSVITIDVDTLSESPITPGSIIVFVGTKLFRADDVWAPTYPKKFTTRPYLNSLFLPNLSIANGPVLNQPFTVEQDADFVFQLGGYTDFSPLGSVTFADEGSGTVVVKGQNGTTINLDDSNIGVPNQPMSITVVGSLITVEDSTDGTGTLIGTAAQAAALINATPAAAALVTATSPFPGPFPVGPPATITGGGGVMNLPDLGFQMRDWRLKSYMNDYIPVSLVFPFLTAQQPGWLFPEIYIPSQQQMFFDFAYLWPNVATPASVNVTLGLKGMKVYPVVV
jgi:hypothetical protein